MISRRRFLRGVCQGAAVATALPLLDIFLDDHGQALAEGGAPMPTRFLTWFWGCGVNPERWIPAQDGANFELSPEMAALAPVRGHINVLSGFDAILDGVGNIPHHTGVAATLTGIAHGIEDEWPGATLDTLIAAKLGAASRFRSIEVSADGVRTHSYSRLDAHVKNQSEVSPLALYERLFGAEFVDPDAAPSAPDPRVMLRQSVLSAVMEDSARLNATLGSHDRARLDQYQTSVRELEKRLDFMLSGAVDLAACKKPDAPGADGLGGDLETVIENHDILSDLLVMALACDQTRVANVLFSWGLSELRVAGTNATHHDLTHNEIIDAELGYQPSVLPFINASMEAWASFVGKLAAVNEGDGTLLDNALVMAHSDSSFAQTHDIRSLPVMTAGRAGGAMRTGLHVRGNGDPITRVGLTMQHLTGDPVASWGTGSMKVSSPISELIV